MFWKKNSSVGGQDSSLLADSCACLPMLFPSILHLSYQLLYPGWLWLSPLRAGPQGRDGKMLAGQTITQYVQAVVLLFQCLSD